MRYAGISSCMADQTLTIAGLLRVPVPLRQVARTKEKKAAQPMFLSSRDAFDRKGQTWDGLEGKFQLIAGGIWLGVAHVVSPVRWMKLGESVNISTRQAQCLWSCDSRKTDGP